MRRGFRPHEHRGRAAKAYLVRIIVGKDEVSRRVIDPGT